MNFEFHSFKNKEIIFNSLFGAQLFLLVVKLIKIFMKMKSRLEDIYSNILEDDFSSEIQSLIFGGVLVFFNLSVMLFVGLYWMNPVIHKFFSGRPLL